MPVPWAINLLVVAWLLRAVYKAAPSFGISRDTIAAITRQPWAMGATFVIAAAAMTVPTRTTVGMTTRYLGDFYPLAAVGAAFGRWAVLPALSRRPTLAFVLAVVAMLLVVWAIVVTLSLNTRLVFY